MLAIWKGKRFRIVSKRKAANSRVPWCPVAGWVGSHAEMEAKVEELRRECPVRKFEVVGEELIPKEREL